VYGSSRRREEYKSMVKDKVLPVFIYIKVFPLCFLYLTVRHLQEKFRAKGKKLYFGFVGLDNLLKGF